MNDSFRVLLAAARSGDPQARAELFERIYPRLQRLAHNSMANEVRLRRPWLTTLFSTGDVVQDVCERALAELHAFQADSENALLAWLRVAVRNRLFDVIRFHEAVRRDCRRASLQADFAEPREPAPGPATQALNGDLVASFWSVADRLPERERRLLRLRALGGSTFEEIAVDLGYPSADAARKALYAAQARLVVMLRSAGLRAGEGS